jgi:hypothetical protein
LLAYLALVVLKAFHFLIAYTIDMKVNLVDAWAHLELVDYIRHHFKKRIQIRLVLATIVPLKLITARKLAYCSSLVNEYNFLATNLAC